MKNFSFSTVDSNEFDEHISQSIVGYEGLVYDIKRMSDYFIGKGELVYDLGCSTGKLVWELSEIYPSARFVGIDNEENFYKDFKDAGNVRFQTNDLHKVEFEESSLVISVFTIQFIPQSHRSELIRKIYSSLKKGGGFIWAEKMLAGSSKVQDMVSSLYYDIKRERFSDEDIMEKERSLRSLMKLMTFRENVDMLKDAGFTKVSVFWKRYAFVGIIAIK